MKFNKFGAFPKTPNLNSSKKTGFDLSSLINILPNLLNKPCENQQVQEQKFENTNQFSPNNSKAYAEYIAKHDEFVKNISRDQEWGRFLLLSTKGDKKA